MYVTIVFKQLNYLPSYTTKNILRKSGLQTDAHILEYCTTKTLINLYTYLHTLTHTHKLENKIPFYTDYNSTLKTFRLSRTKTFQKLDLHKLKSISVLQEYIYIHFLGNKRTEIYIQLSQIKQDGTHCYT